MTSPTRRQFLIAAAHASLGAALAARAGGQTTAATAPATTAATTAPTPIDRRAVVGRHPLRIGPGDFPPTMWPPTHVGAATLARRADGQQAVPDELTLDLWTGVAIARFAVDGGVVEIATVADPASGAIALRVPQLDARWVTRASPDVIADPATFDAIAAASARGWERFWLDGAAIDLAACVHPHASALERGIVHARYESAARGAATEPVLPRDAHLAMWGGAAPTPAGAHAIFFAEQAYRAAPTRETLDRHCAIVDAAARRSAEERPADGAFELAYRAWSLGCAQRWRERLGQPRDARWDEAIAKLPKPTVRDGIYVETEGTPSPLLALGLLPKTHVIDEHVMRATARASTTDGALRAMTLARLGESAAAIDALLGGERNDGALLSAVAMMAGGWDGLDADARPTPGFPADWPVRAEGFARAI